MLIAFTTFFFKVLAFSELLRYGGEIDMIHHAWNMKCSKCPVDEMNGLDFSGKTEGSFCFETACTWCPFSMARPACPPVRHPC